MNHITGTDHITVIIVHLFLLYFLTFGQNSTIQNQKRINWRVIHTSFKQQTEITISSLIVLSLHLTSPWVSTEFVGWLVWKRSSLLNWSCALSQHKQRPFPPGPSLANWPSAEGVHALAARCPPASTLSFSVCSQEKLSPFRSKDGGGIRHMWTWNGLISRANTQSIIWVSSCKVASLCAGPIENRTAMWSTDGAAYGWVKVWNDKKKIIIICSKPIIQQTEQMSVNPHF